MKRKVLIACVALLSVVLLGCLLFIVKMESQLAKLPETEPPGEVGSKDTVEIECPGVSTQNTDPGNTTEITGASGNTTTPTEAPVQTQPKETTPLATTEPTEATKPAETTKPTQSTKPAETTKPTESTKPVETTASTQNTEPTKDTASTDEKLDEDELPFIPD